MADEERRTTFKDMYAKFTFLQRLLVVTSFVCFVLTAVAITLDATSWVISGNTRSSSDQNIRNTLNGNLYTYDACFLCQSSGCGEFGSTPCMTLRARVSESVLTTMFSDAAVALKYIYFPSASTSGSYFEDQVQIDPRANLILYDHVLTNAITNLQIGYYDFNDTTNTTSVCRNQISSNGAIYHAVSTSDDTQRYLCLCVNIPFNFGAATELCKPMTVYP